MKRVLLIAGIAFAVLSFAQGQTISRNNSASELTLVGRARVSAIYDIKAVPPYAYALERGVLRVLDVRDPAAVREVGSLEFERPRSRIALRYPYLYLAGFNQPLGVIDISRPTRPRWVAEYPDLGVTTNDGFELAGDSGYLIRREGDTGETPLFLDVLDVGNNPDRPQRVGSLDLGVRVAGEYGGIAHEDGRVFILVSRAVGGARRSRLIIVDARLPDKPRIERTMLLPEGKLYRDVEVRGDLLFLLQAGSGQQQASGLAVYRMRAEGEPELLGEALSPKLSFPIDLIVQRDVVYATFKVGIIAAFDVSIPRAPKIAHTYAQKGLWSAGLGMALADNRLYVAGDNGSSPILDVSEPRAPRLLGRWEYEGGSVSDVLLEGKLAILISFSDLLFFDVSDPRAPRLLGRHEGVPSYDPNDWQWNMVAAARGSHVFVAYETIPAQLLDITNTARPLILGEFKPRGLVHAIVLTPTRAFLGYRSPAEGRTSHLMDPSSLTERGGIEVVDLRDPRNIRTAADLDLGPAVTDLALNRGRLVAVHPDGSLTILDIRDQNSPSIVGRLAGSESAGIDRSALITRVALSADGRLAYVVHSDLRRGDNPFGRGRGILTLVDLQDATQPRVLSRLIFERDGGTELAITVRGNYAVILAGGTGDLLIVDATDPARPAMKFTKTFPPGVFNSGLALGSNHVYIGASEDGLMIYRLPPALR